MKSINWPEIYDFVAKYWTLDFNDSLISEQSQIELKEKDIYEFIAARNQTEVPGGHAGNGEGSLKVVSIGEAFFFLEISLAEEEDVRQFPIAIFSEE